MNEIITDTEIENMINEFVEFQNEQSNESISEHQELHVNSNSYLIDESTSRFSSAIWYEKIQSKNIILAGLGGIGSYVAFLLSRLKVNTLHIFDGDTVEEANLSGQLYSSDNIGQNKTEAVFNIIKMFSKYYSVYTYGKYIKGSLPSDIMICGFDNMKARKIFYNNWKEYVNSKEPYERKNCLFIDGRLAAEEFQILCVKGDDTYNMEKYEKEFLFSDEEADATVCSYKQTTFVANMIASYMVNLFVNFVANECDPLMERDVPFYTYYDATNMYFKTIA